MSERIKALAVEADFMLCEDGHFYSEGQSQKITDQLQKFAELIVRECALVLDKNITPPSHPFNSIGYKLKQHFGVNDE